MCCLSAKLDLLLIQNSRVLQSIKGYHNPKFGLGFGFFLLFLLKGLFPLLLKLSRDFVSSHNTSAKHVL